LLNAEEVDMKNFLCKLAILVLALLLYAGPAHAQTLTSGTTIAGSIPMGGMSTQTFNGSSGQEVILSVDAGITVDIVVKRPNNTTLTSANNRVEVALDASGTFTVQLTGAGGAATSYNLAYLKGDDSVSNGALTSGQPYNGTLAVNGIESFTFSGTAGQGILLYVNSSYTAQIQIFDPSGALVTDANTRFADNSLPSTGTYTAVVIGVSTSSSGTYTLNFLAGASTVSDGQLQSGTIYGGTLAVNGINSFQFTATAGQAFNLFIQASYTPEIFIYKPDGSFWNYASDRYQSNSLPNTGTYTAVVVGNSSTYSGPFTAYFVQGEGNVSEGSLISGSTRNGTLPLNGLNSYTFTGQASSTLTVTSTASFTRTLMVYKADGSLLAGPSSSISTTLPAVTGNYTVVFYGNSDTYSGAYTITLTVTSPSPPASTSSDCPVCDELAALAATTASLLALPMDVGPAISPILGDAFAAPWGAPPGMGYSLASAGNTMSAVTSAITGAAPYFGAGMQFDDGFTQQTVTDYQAGGLSFVRTYRSNTGWTNNTIGTYWFHNYSRVLTVVPTTSATITDGTGATTSYTWSGSAWVPTDPSTRATLQTVGTGWVYTLPNNTVEKYNSSELLTRIEYFGGGALNLTYNGSNQLTGIANENGRSLSLTYDGSGRVSTLVTPDGTFTYAYDTNSNLITVTKPDTKTEQYSYTNATYVNALTGVTNEKGNAILAVAYDGSGRPTSTQGAGGVSDYGVTYTTSTGTNPLGKVFTYHFKNAWAPGISIRRIIQVDGAATTNTPASSEYYNYDAWGRMIGKTDWAGNTTRYAYDGHGNVIGILEGTYTAQQRLTYIVYNATWNVPATVYQPGKTTAYVYDAYGRLTSVTVTDTATSATRTTTYSYYSNSTDGSGNVILGRLETITGPRTDLTEATTYAYDGNFNLTTITNALSQVTTITARDSAGRPTKITDPNSVETDLTYDTNGRLQTAVQASGTALAATTTFTYDDDGDLTKVTLPNSVYLEYSYDTAQRLTGIQDSFGNTETYTLDNAGNMTQVVVKNTTPATTYTHSATFDELSRLLHSIGASSQTAVYTYDTDSNLTSYTDPNTNPTTNTFDALNRLATTTNALSGVTTPGYNALDDLTSVKDQRSNSTTYTYNAFGDVTGETSPDRGTLSYTVDKAGNVTQRTDARSVVTNYTYDAINRLSTVAYPSDSSLNASLTYDSSSGCGTPYIGHLCSVTDAAGTTAYQYDVLGRVTQEKDTRSSLNFTTSYSYDLAGNITGVTLPSGRTVTYTLDSNGRVSGVSAVVNGTSTTLASSITYLPFGPLNALTYGNSLTFSGTFDQDYNPTNRTISGSIANWTYTTDSNGNIKEAGSTTYGFDALNRVNAENPGSSVSYTYDATSNRLTKVSGGTTTTTVPAGSNKISAVGSNSYTYDSSGNITADGVNTYTWNAEGELSVVKVGGTTVGTYTYNLYRQRAKKVAASTAYYVYGAGGLLYGEYDTSGNFIREYIYLNGAPLAQIDAGSPEVLTYIHTDHLGTPRFGTNTSGTQVWSWNNDAFGTSTPSGTATVNLRMAGQYFDSESGLFYNWNRVYNPAIGRYISSDPIGLAGGLNTFLYVGANPVMRIDPRGFDFWDTSNMFLNWLTDTGPTNVSWGPYDKGFFGGSPSNEMKSSPSVAAARQAFEKKNVGICSFKDAQALTDYIGDWDGSMWDNANWTERFVGGYRIDVYPNPDGSVSFVITNVTSFPSFVGHPDGLNDWERTQAPYVGGNTRQTYWWRETLP
jgi:RHS repeat-associated protein